MSDTPRTDAHLRAHQWVEPEEPETVELLRNLEREVAKLHTPVLKSEWQEMVEALNGTLGALAYWMPDETLVKPYEEDVWDRHIKITQHAEAVLKSAADEN